MHSTNSSGICFADNKHHFSNVYLLPSEPQVVCTNAMWQEGRVRQFVGAHHFFSAIYTSVDHLTSLCEIPLLYHFGWIYSIALLSKEFFVVHLLFRSGGCASDVLHHHEFDLEAAQQKNGFVASATPHYSYSILNNNMESNKAHQVKNSERTK